MLGETESNDGREGSKEKGRKAEKWREGGTAG